MSSAVDAPPRTAPRRAPARSQGNNKRSQQGGQKSHQNHQDRSHRQNQLRHGGKVQEDLLSAAQKRRRPSENDVALILKSGALIGSATVSAHMKPYMFDAQLCKLLLADHQERAKNSRSRHHMNQIDTVESAFDFRKTWNQLNLAAVVLASVVDPASQILFVASNERAGVSASRAASQLKAQSIIGRYVPGTLSNPAQKTFIEPTWVVCASASEDVQAIKETASSNTAVIAFCDATANLTNIDIPIGCNTRSRLGIGLMFYLLLRQTLRHKGVIPYDSEIENLMVDHFIQQKNKNVAEEEEETAGAAEQDQQDAQSNELRADAGQNDANWDDNFGDN